MPYPVMDRAASPANEVLSGEIVARTITQNHQTEGGLLTEPHRQRLTATYYTMSGGLNRFLRSLDLSADEAEDVMQEAFFRLTRQLDEGSRIEKIEAWIFQVAHNLSMDIHRANRRSNSDTFPAPEYTEEPVDSRTDPERALLEKEKAARVRVAISRLTPRQFRSLKMRAQGKRYREIAEALGVSEQRAIHLVKRARLRLAEGA